MSLHPLFLTIRCSAVTLEVNNRHSELEKSSVFFVLFNVITISNSNINKYFGRVPRSAYGDCYLRHTFFLFIIFVSCVRHICLYVRMEQLASQRKGFYDILCLSTFKKFPVSLESGKNKEYLT